MWYAHAIEYYSAMKRNEAHTHGPVWKKLKKIMSRERRQMQNPRCYLSPFKSKIENGKIHRERRKTHKEDGAETDF